MAKPAHTLVTFSGVIGSGAAQVETWSFSVKAAQLAAGDRTIANLIAIANECQQRYADNFVTHTGEDTVLTNVRVAAIDATGHVEKTADGEYVQGDHAANWAGTEAKQPMPLQTALCVSLNTARAGATGKGRFFLPWPAMSLDATDKRIPVAQATPFLGYVVNFLTGVQDALGVDLQVVSSKGYMSPVTGVRLGRVPDTMRSRREDSPEGYVSAVFP